MLKMKQLYQPDTKVYLTVDFLTVDLMMVVMKSWLLIHQDGY